VCSRRGAIQIHVYLYLYLCVFKIRAGVKSQTLTVGNEQVWWCAQATEHINAVYALLSIRCQTLLTAASKVVVYVGDQSCTAFRYVVYPR